MHSLELYYIPFHDWQTLQALMSLGEFSKLVRHSYLVDMAKARFDSYHGMEMVEAGVLSPLPRLYAALIQLMADCATKSKVTDPTMLKEAVCTYRFVRTGLN